MEEQVIKEYKPGKTSLRDIAEIFNTNHHRIKRILVKNDIEIIKAIRWIYLVLLLMPKCIEEICKCVIPQFLRFSIPQKVW